MNHTSLATRAHDAMVVVCDADTIATQLLTRILNRAGYHVVACGTASECQSLIAQYRADLAILAILLPDQDGLSLVRDLRRQHDSLRIVVLSALQAEARSTEAGANLFLNKPVHPSRLLEALAQLGGGSPEGEKL